MVSSQDCNGAPAMATAKESANKIIDQLPDQATWTDIMYELYVKQKIDAGLKAAAEGRTIPHESVKQQLLSDAD
jgi:predicted transcriptional regulator